MRPTNHRELSDRNHWSADGMDEYGDWWLQYEPMRLKRLGFLASI